MTKSLLLEIGLEEVPAKYVSSSCQQLKERVENFLKDHHLSFEDITTYGTPRRFAVIVKGLNEYQDDTVEVFKGPAKAIALDTEGNWTKAALGFVKGKGLDVQDIYFEDLKGVEYVHVKKETKGQATMGILPGLKDVITAMTFPVSMTWNKHHLKYIRPIHWLIAQFGDETVPFDILGIHTATTSRGHRFLGQDTSIQNADQYLEKLAQEHVIADFGVRKAMILAQIEELAQANNWIVHIDEELLEEVTNIVEYPTAFFGTFDEKYLQIPDQVLITTMKEHQRYFYVQDQAGQLLPYFISVRNGNAHAIENVARGNEKVLTARLEDALFFTHEDAKIQIADAVEKLKSVNFHFKIGSIYDKMANTKEIVDVIGQILEADVSDALRAADIYKFDLVTNMVDEFPELQGIMGEKYALDKGENPQVAQAIREHYLPLGSDAQLPESFAGSVLALADKLDTLLSFFKIGLIPTGSNDPYALRRTAIGIMRILKDRDWGFDLDELFSLLLNDLYGVPYEAQNDILTQLHEFMAQRVQQDLQAKGVRYDLVQAALEVDVFSIPFIMDVASELQVKSQEAGFKETIEAVTRVVNLFDKSFEVEFELEPFKPALAQTKSEKDLYNALESVDEVAFDTFKALTPYISQFFEDNMVFVDDLAIRNNRLCLIADCAQLILYYMDPTKIVKG